MAEKEVEESDLLDPHPDICALFCYYNSLYFGNTLGACSVHWSSSRMTMCAGVCRYGGAGGCEIRLSEPLLKYRTAADLKETLLHEMIHAYLFLTENNRDRDDHGPRFQEKMQQINGSQIADLQRPAKGYAISIYHQFSEEVELYRTHHWTCERCGRVIRRAQNRAPSINDCIFKPPNLTPNCSSRCGYHMHEASCGGAYKKTAEPAGFKVKDHRMPLVRRSKKQKISPSASYHPGKGVVCLENFFPIKSATVPSVARTCKGESLEPRSNPELDMRKSNKPSSVAEGGSDRKVTREVLKRGRRRIQTKGDVIQYPTVIIAWKAWWAFEEEDEDFEQLVDKRRKGPKKVNLASDSLLQPRGDDACGTVSAMNSSDGLGRELTSQESIAPAGESRTQEDLAPDHEPYEFPSHYRKRGARLVQRTGAGAPQSDCQTARLQTRDLCDKNSLKIIVLDDDDDGQPQPETKAHQLGHKLVGANQAVSDTKSGADPYSHSVKMEIDDSHISRGNGKGSMSCPICNKVFPKTYNTNQINWHLDRCLAN